MSENRTTQIRRSQVPGVHWNLDTVKNCSLGSVYIICSVHTYNLHLYFEGKVLHHFLQ